MITDRTARTLAATASALVAITIVPNVELWITLRGGGKWMTIVETNVMTFDRNARVSRNAEYWSLRQGGFAPPRGWGSGS